MSFESFIAKRYLGSKRKEIFISIITVISVLGVAISVAVLNIVLSIMTGFEAELQKKLVDANAHVLIRSYLGELPNSAALVEKIKTVSGVTDTFPYTFSQAMVTGNNTARGLLIRGVVDTNGSKDKLKTLYKEGADEKNIAKLFSDSKVTIERPDGESDEVSLPSIIIGRSLAEKLGIGIGDPISIFSAQFLNSPQGLMPRSKRFIVVDTYHSGLMEYENGIAYISLASADKYFGFEGKVTGVEVVVEDLNKAAEIGTNIINSLGEAASGLVATDWTQPNKALWEALKLEKRVYFIVLLLLILVASFSIVSTLVMVVMEKSRDIGVLKTLGATDRQCMKIFFIQGSIIGLTGTILGTIIGLLGCVGLRKFGFKLDESVFSMDQVPVHMIPLNFVIVAVVGFIISSLAGIYPAFRASRIKPADVLRFE